MNINIKNTTMKSFEPRPWMAPQPVLIIGTYDENGVANAMNAAWGGQWDATEVMISMGNHATTKNLERSADFTLAFANVDTMVAADYVGLVSARKEPRKIEKTGWTTEKAPNVDAPLFTDFPMTMECRVTRKIDESASGFYLVADIINVIVNEKYVAEDGKPDLGKMNLITFDPIHNGYIALGERVGNAFEDGKKIR